MAELDQGRTPIRIIVLGRPGAGKGTQGSRLAERLGLPHISTGDLLRAAISADLPLGRSVRSHVASGRLVPDDVVAQAVAERLDEDDARTCGYVLDGYPRSVAQLITLERLIAPASLTGALELVLPEREAAHRLLSRRRDDDDVTVIRRRFDEYERCTKALLDWLDLRGLLVSVGADRSPDQVHDSVVEALAPVLDRAGVSQLSA